MGLGLSTPKLEYTTWHNKYSIEVDGANDYMTMDGVAGEINVNLGTFSAWIKLDSTAINGVILKASIDSNNNIALTYVNSTEKIQMQYKGGGTSKIAAGAFENEGDDTWYHVMGTWDTTSSGYVKLYINGSLQQTSTGLGTFSGTIDKVYSGRNTLNSNSYFHGHIDNLAIFNNVQDATDLYNGGKPNDITSYSGLVGHWRMGEGSGTSIADKSSNNNATTLVHSPAWTTDIP